MEQILTEIAAKTGAAIPHITDLALRGMQFEGIFGIIITTALSLLGIALLIFCIKGLCQLKHGDEEAPYCIGIIIGCALLLAGFGCGCDGGFLSPSAWMKATMPDVYIVNQARHKILDGQNNGQ